LSKQDNLSIKLRPVEENDIAVLYEMLKEMLTALNASVNERPLPSYEDSKKYVMKYLQDNENHEIDNWYIIIDENNTVLGSTKISNKGKFHSHNSFTEKRKKFLSIKIWNQKKHF